MNSRKSVSISARSLFQSSVGRLKSVNDPEAESKTRQALSICCDISSLDIALGATLELPQPSHQRLERWLTQMARGVPPSRLEGQRRFWDHDFDLAAATLDPRADSETLIDACLQVVASSPKQKHQTLRLLDLGVGTGCLLLSLLAALPNASGVGIDVHPDAVEMTKLNARRMGLSDRTDIYLRNWLEGHARSGLGCFDIIVSNPPYIDHNDADLDASAALYDPSTSLIAEDNGLADYETILRAAPSVLAAEGMLFLEIGHRQADEVQKLGHDLGWVTVQLFQDLSGHDRVILLRLR